MSKPISDKPIVKALVELCHLHGVEQVIISPGSRNAPLIISFNGCERFECLSIVDERSAAYFALGLAREKKKPVALVCTSGTAALNYAPAVAEAYYQKIPLVVITADRPKEWINQADGQAIDQPGIYNNFIRHQCTLPLSGGHSDDEWYMNRMLNEAFQKCNGTVPGPIHINVPMREPLYGKTVYPEKTARKIELLTGDSQLSEEAIALLTSEIERYERVMVITGAMYHQPELKNALELLAKKGVVVLTETLSNLESDNFTGNMDRIVSTITEDEHLFFSPDMLITLDVPVLSKMIKKILRKTQPKIHWHFSNHHNITDTYQALSRIIKGNAAQILQQVASKMDEREKRFRDTWNKRATLSAERHTQYFDKLAWCDLKLYNILSETNLPSRQIHLGNSTPVRYAQLFNWNEEHTWYANRGTSGIDGCVSTAAGAAFGSDKPVLLITGDLSFLYDSNGLWHKYLPESFRIIIVNNGGGGIFRFIHGPTDTEELEEFFETKHSHNCEGIARTFGLDYHSCKNADEVTEQLKTFFNPSNKPAVMEVFTPNVESGKLLKQYFKFLKNEI
ncbi:2-succinyl-5-enolpyruvyl-6-hydroxy-3-cyclohexene-1-carboxylic-acid synthase [Alkalitalea saponilacus]|uniref:2-succinyl-5-enolpyruvyl-6-hydroxy-3-cyclohexene-1-carboxylate synthase n=1 Tax=Alkalitalea saponilacus TaxID=889453 RepID=A0A1T5CDF5_9BACT|nr:2-succinyl-5-enolpyruvyl-6-hydroxy-3-cyclohexene-1-carboxylic-acid synthase [Alkalitalea saponilacus]ASB49823.1 2-succinyl-5-enolpyruvyl-6-hydroxy-3-cyclohexene-1-carboxylic-acid synthase [Alkalitalea saponilacus]SKB57371.1 2-succinyl-5-enolpyruvyl-6-hydroxy-3-cyclohexene-1-carboxylate synthase [Alkalitalea saponilacus]